MTSEEKIKQILEGTKKENNSKRVRRSIRMKEIDYSLPGMYFITLCTEDRKCLFGFPEQNKMVLNEFGKIVEEEWEKSSEIRKEIVLDAFVVMPNHLHGIIYFKEDESRKTFTDQRAHGRAPLQTPVFSRKPKSLGAFIAGFKAATTKRINILRISPGVILWQRNYFEHIVRDQKELDAIREYIFWNPAKWEADEYFSQQQKHLEKVVSRT